MQESISSSREGAVAALTERERDYLLSYLCGYAPEVIDQALNALARTTLTGYVATASKVRRTGDR